MKKVVFLILGVFCLGNSFFLHAQRGHVDRYADINFNKVESVAEAKTEQLDDVVRLDKKKQKKKVYQIYKNNEVKKQKKLKDAKHVQRHRYRRRPNRVRVSHTEYDERKENLLLEKLDQETNKKIKEVLTHQQRQRLAKQEEKEKAAIIQ